MGSPGSLTLPSVPAEPFRSGRITSEARAGNVLINSGIGVATVMVRQLAAGRFRWREIGRGLVGGALTSAGKQVVGEGFDGSGFVGRQVSAMGVSLIASSGQDSLTLVFPVGPAQFVIRPASPDRFRARADLFDVALVLHGLIDGGQRLDLRTSLSAGTPVFLRPRDSMPLGHHSGGLSILGTVYLGDELAGPARRAILAHEIIHVLQSDAYKQSLAYPAERYMTKQVPGLRRLLRYADLGVVGPATLYPIVRLTDYEGQPWEREAYRLTGGVVCTNCP